VTNLYPPRCSNHKNSPDNGTKTMLTINIRPDKMFNGYNNNTNTRFTMLHAVNVANKLYPRSFNEKNSIKYTIK